MQLKQLLAGGVSAAALGLAFASAAQAQNMFYKPGDWHNHTTCSDGSLSPADMMTPPIAQFGLAFLVQTDHGGSYDRDCHYDNTSYNVTTTAQSSEADRIANGALWVDTIGAAAILGDPVFTTSYANGRTVPAMWRWQNIQQFEYPQIRALGRTLGYPTMFEGYEQIAPGHEHATMTILDGQITTQSQALGSAAKLARWEYEFDRTDADFSGGFSVNGRVRAGWNNTPDTKTKGVDANGNPVYVTASNFSTQNAGNLGHARSVVGVQWLQANYPITSVYTPSHVERAGVFSPTGNGGWNVEHFRDYNNVAPTVAFGFDTEPGHQASASPGEYSNCLQAPGTPGRGITCPGTQTGFNSVGGFAYGGVGIYGAQIGGLWDALLGEGRNFWFFGSSDFHNRGIFVPPDRRSTADFFPGEYQKTYIPAAATRTPRSMINGLRAGNAYTVQGDLVGDDFNVTATDGTSTATMGGTLVVAPGASVTVKVTFRLPTTNNNSPYSFNNPILLQDGINQPINRPVLDHLDLITGQVTGIVPRGNDGAYYTAPTNSAYTNATNPTAALVATYSATGINPWHQTGNNVTITYTIPSVTGPMYIRTRGTNLPANTPNATDANGNPLRDDGLANIVCSDPACPSHLSGVIPGDPTLRVGYDVRAWSDLWVYGNPIYIRTTNDAQLRAEVNAALAHSLGAP